MGNKTSPRAFRVGITQDHDAHWYVSRKDFANTFHQDCLIRKYLLDNFKNAKISKIEINRTRAIVEVKILCVRRSVILGKKGSVNINIEEILRKKFKKEFKVAIFELKKPEIDAACVAQDVAGELVKRGASVRNAIKRSVQNAKRNGAVGVRIECSGRLSGAEIARTDWFQNGPVPRQTLRANLDYATATAYCAWGTCGVKVWIYKGDKLENHEGVENDIRA